MNLYLGVYIFIYIYIYPCHMIAILLLIASHVMCSFTVAAPWSAVEAVCLWSHHTGASDWHGFVERT